MSGRLSRLIGAASIAGGLMLSATTGMAADFSNILEKIKLPPGFKISVFAELPKPRSLAVASPLNTVFVGSRHGTLHSLRDTNRDGIADENKLRSEGLNVPNGVAVQDGILYVAENDKVSMSPIPAEFDTALPVPLIPIKADLPAKFLHGWRYMKFGPDRKLYVAIGSPYNIGMPEGMEGTIIRMDPDGKNVETVARGVRNSVGFDFHPKTGDLFFSDNGADGMGDDVPPDEFNHVTKAGQHFGYPYMGGKSARLPADKNENTNMKIGSAPAGIVGPVIEFQAHSANLGVHFYRGSQFPAEYKNDAFVAQHGSWNRTSPVGYRIMRIRFNDKGEAVGKEVFAEGWLENGTANGRPVDFAELGDGSLLVSDDFANVIYRISYGN